MRVRGFKPLLVCVTLILVFLAARSAPASAEEQIVFQFRELKFHSQTVEVRHAGGNTSRAEFLSEMILLPDGRATGGFGLWEDGAPNGLLLYRVVAGRTTNRGGPFYEFQARRLSPAASEDEITISLHPVPGHVPEGSVTFFIDGVSSPGGEVLSFEAGGTVHSHARSHSPTATLSDFVTGSFFINAPPQTVVVETRGSSYTAVFENVALVFPDGDAIGLASLSQSEIRFTGGNLHFPDGEFMGALLHGRTSDTRTSQPLPVLMVIADSH